MGLIVLLVVVAAFGYAMYRYYPKDKTTIQQFETIVKEDVAKVEKVTEDAATEVKEVAQKVAKKAKAEIAEKRARKDGKFVADDPSTPDVNEAFTEGKAPPKRVKKPKIEVSK